MGTTLPRIGLYHRSDRESSYTQFCSGVTSSVPIPGCEGPARTNRLIANGITHFDATSIYNDYGQYVEHFKAEKSVQDATADAWKRGWGGFFAAACETYWYLQEEPDLLEPIDSRFSNSTGNMASPAWLDFSQKFLTDPEEGQSKHNQKDRIAYFLYNMWDDIELRAPRGTIEPDYEGDNDDLSLGGSFIAARIPERFKTANETDVTLLGSTHVDAFRKAVVKSLGTSPRAASVDSLFSHLFTRGGKARSATATLIDLSGNHDSRSLSWQDNTPPASAIQWTDSYNRVLLSMQLDDKGRNNEEGFRIFRRPITDDYIWDGRLSTYPSEPTGSVAADVTSWTDEEDLESGLYSYVVTAFNSSGNSVPRAQRSITVTKPVNRAPTVTGDTEASIPENGEAPWSLGSYTGNDPDGDEITWSLNGTDSESFKLTGDEDSRQLELIAEPDYETKSSYSVSVVVADPDGLTSQIDITVSVTNVNEPPSITGSAEPEIVENSEAVGDYDVTDPDQGDTHTWSLQNDSSNYFSISATGALAFNSAPNYEVKNSYTVTVVVTDQGGLSSQKRLTVTVKDENEAPSITGSAEPEIVENSEAVGDYDVTDPDQGDTHTWSLQDDPSNYFSISETGALTFNSAPNYEVKNSYTVTVVVTDRGGLSRTKEVTVTVQDVNEPPVITGASTASITENSTELTLATYNVTDPDANDTHTWTMKDGNAFSLLPDRGSSSVLSFKSSPDYETRSSYNPTIVVTDRGGLKDEHPVAVTVNDTNECFTVSGPSTAAIDENTSTALGVYSAVDPDGDQVVFRLAGEHASSFQMSGAGVLSFRSEPDYEARATYNVTIAATDNRGCTEQIGMVVTVRDVNEAPTVDGSGGVSVAEGTTLVGTYTGNDPEMASLTWRLGGDDKSKFELRLPLPGQPADQQRSRNLHFKTAPVYSHATASENYYSVVVGVEDSEHDAEREVDVTVTDVDDPPVLTLKPSTPRVLQLIQATLSDPDGGVRDVTWSWRRIKEDGTNSVLASTNSYRVVLADLDHVLQCVVAYTDNNGPNKRATVSTAKVKPNKPGAVGNLTAVDGNETITLSWSAAPANGAAIQAYEYECEGTWASTTSLSVEIDDLDNGTEYTCAVKAKNSEGYGATKHVKATPATTPGAVQNLTATRGDQTASLTWEAPESDGGAVVTYEYRQLRVSPGNAIWSSWASTGQNLRASPSSLTNGTPYTWEVRAKNRKGAGPSSSVSATPAGRPGAPKSLTTDRPAIGSVRISWEAADANGEPITRYQYRRKAGTTGSWRGWFTVSGGGSARTRTVTGLRDLVRYIWEVRAENAVGWGDTATVTTQPKGLGGSSGVEEGSEADNIGANEGEPDTAMDGAGASGKVVATAPVGGEGAYPNPFNAEVEIAFQVLQDGPVSLRVYNTAGQLVTVLEDAPRLGSGWHLRSWHGEGQDGRPVGSGVYLYRLIAGGEVKLGKVALIR